MTFRGLQLQRVLLYPPGTPSAPLLLPLVRRQAQDGAKLQLSNVTLVTRCSTVQQYSMALASNADAGRMFGQELAEPLVWMEVRVWHAACTACMASA